MAMEMKTSELTEPKDLNFNIITTDCLLHIISYLELRDQINLSQVNSRLENVQRYYWNLKLRKMHLNVYMLGLTTADFDQLMRLSCDWIEILILKSMDSTKLAVLKEYTFPKVHDFRFSQADPYYMSDENLKDLYKVFPALYTFSPQGRFTGEHIICWQQLRHLTVSYCAKFSVSNLAKILMHLRLETFKMNVIYNCGTLPFDECMIPCFQTLRMCVFNDVELLYYIADNLRYCTHLREIIVTALPRNKDMTCFFELFERHKCNDVLSLEYANINAVCLRTMRSRFQFLRNLHKLSFLNVMDIFTWAVKTEFLNLMPALRVVTFYHCEAFVESEILDFLGVANNLENINIQYCTLHFQPLNLRISHTLRHRTKPLLLNFHWNHEVNQTTIVKLNVVDRDAQAILQVRDVSSTNICYDPIRVTFRNAE